MESSNSSEFGSGDEDAEFALYAKLYFEPNQELAHVNVDDGLVKGNGANTIIDSSNSLQGSQVHKIQNSFEVPHRTKTETKATKNRSYLEANLSNIKIPLVTASVPVQSSRNMIIDDKPNKVHSSVKRERQSSVCSVESISGRVPLDSLYCNVMNALDEEDESLFDRLSKPSFADSVGNSSVKRGNHAEEKRKMTQSSDSSDKEDSRCKNLEKLGSDKNKNGRSKKQKVVPTHMCIDSLNDSDSRKRKKVRKKKKKKRMCIDNNDSTDVICLDSSDSSDICILPQPHKEKTEVSNRGSGGTNEVSKCKTQSTDRITKSSIQVRNNCNLLKREGVVIVTGDDDSEKECLTQRKPASDTGISSESDSESDLDDIQEMPIATKLTMNFDNGMSPVVNGFGLDTNMNFELKNYLRKHDLSKSNLEYTKGRPLSKKHPSCKPWTPEMTSYYDSDLSDDFDVEEVHSQQSNIRSDWNIISSDYGICSRNRYYNQQARCKQCRQFGHTTEECPRVPHCYICSETDHTTRNKCPSNCCFRCGGPPHSYCSLTASSVRCPLCGNNGHSESACPDLWRRYHLTTSGSVPVPALSPLSKQANKKIYCCVCGRRGHYGHDCPLKHTTIKLMYSIQAQSVISYNQPIVNVDGDVDINLEGAKASENMIKIPIYNNEIGRIIGRGGAVINSMSQRTGADITVIDHKDKSYLQIYGDLQAQTLSRDAVQEILGRNLRDSKSSALMRSMSRNRNKQRIIKIIRDKIMYYSCLRNKLLELPSIVDVLKEGQKMQLMAKSPTPEFLKKLEKSLYLASQIVVGHLKYGEGKDIFNHVYQQISVLKKLSQRDKVSMHILEDIVWTFEKIDKPPLEGLDRILNLAEMHLNRLDQVLNKSKVGSKIIELKKENDCKRLNGVIEDVKLRKRKLGEEKENNFKKSTGLPKVTKKKTVVSSKRKRDPLSEKAKRKKKVKSKKVLESIKLKKKSDSKRLNGVIENVNLREGKLEQEMEINFREMTGFPKNKKKRSKKKQEPQNKKARMMKNVKRETDVVKSRKLKKEIDCKRFNGVIPKLKLRKKILEQETQSGFKETTCFSKDKKKKMMSNKGKQDPQSKKLIMKNVEREKDEVLDRIKLKKESNCKRLNGVLKNVKSRKRKLEQGKESNFKESISFPKGKEKRSVLSGKIKQSSKKLGVMKDVKPEEGEVLGRRKLKKESNRKIITGAMKKVKLKKKKKLKQEMESNFKKATGLPKVKKKKTVLSSKRKQDPLSEKVKKKKKFKSKKVPVLKRTQKTKE